MNKTSINQFYKRCLDLGLLCLTSIVVYTLLFPNTWVNHIQIWKGTIGAGIISQVALFILLFIFLVFTELFLFKGKITNHLKKRFDIGKIIIFLISLTLFITFILLMTNIVFGNFFFDFNNYILFEFERGSTNIFSDLMSSGYMTLFSMTPFLLIGLFLFILVFFKRKNEILEKNKLLVLSSFMLIFIFILGSSIGGYIASARYQIILYPIYAILFSIFLFSFIRNKKIISLVLFLSLITLFLGVPYFFHYDNSLNVNNYRITDAWGVGGYELAQKMNQLPNAKNITVWVDREGFNDFFVGKSYWRGRSNPFNEEDIDYLILTNGGNRIFQGALNAYKEGRKYFYATVAGEYPMLDYYSKESEYKICINDNPNNCVWAVKFENNINQSSS